MSYKDTIWGAGDGLSGSKRAVGWDNAHRARRTTDATVEPITSAQVKLYARIDTSDDDALVTSLITAARRAAEDYSNRAFITQTWTMYLDTYPDTDYIELPRPYLQSTSFAISSFDEDDTETTFSSDNYIISTNSLPGRVTLRKDNVWPSDLRAADGIKIVWKCGWGASADNVPDDVKTAVKLIFNEMYQHRLDADFNATMSEQVPYASRAILNSYRVPNI